MIGVRWQLSTAVRYVFPLIVVLAIFSISSCYDEPASPPKSAANSTTLARETAVRELPKYGKQRLPDAPPNAVFGMIYFNSTVNREYIYDGADWVPHDETVEDCYKMSTSQKSTRLLSAPVFPTGPPLPTPTGAHGLPISVAGGPTKHGGYDCKVCHVVGGVFSFDPIGPAVATGQPLPVFDTIAKTCSNVSCHGIYSGTFSYYFPGGDGEPELKTVNYAGSGGSTPSWYATGLGCAACHGNPPRNGAWHSGYHAGSPTDAPNQCQFCHPDATGYGGQGTAITNAALHGNGMVNVQVTFRSSCFGCH